MQYVVELGKQKTDLLGQISTEFEKNESQVGLKPPEKPGASSITSISAGLASKTRVRRVLAYRPRGGIQCK
jgi:hypothetical protein